MADGNLYAFGLCLRGAALLAIPFAIGACTNPNQEESMADTVHMCSSCHGIEGRSISPTFPRLAGQHKDYLVAQLIAFREHTRDDRNARTYMWGMAAHLVDASRRENVAAYFSSQTPVAGTQGDPADVAAGRKLYEANGPDRDAPACTGCHGDHAQGSNGSPRLAGQHHDYLERRLETFAADVRAEATGHKTAKTLSEDQIGQLAAYLESE